MRTSCHEAPRSSRRRAHRPGDRAAAHLRARGTPHLLAYITAQEAALLGSARGGGLTRDGQKLRGPSGVPAFDNSGDGGDGADGDSRRRSADGHGDSGAADGHGVPSGAADGYMATAAARMAPATAMAAMATMVATASPIISARCCPGEGRTRAPRSARRGAAR